MIKKKTLLLVIALAAVSGAGYAQEESNVAVYGRLNVGMVNYAGYGDGRGTVTQQNNLASRLGFRGQEYLGNGLRAIFVIETGFSPDTGAGALGSRETTVGLQGDFGKVRFGYMLNALDDLHAIAGPGYQTNVTNDNLNGFWANGYGNTFTGSTSSNPGSDGCKQVAGNAGNTNSFAFDNRYGNSIRYDSPSINGVNVATHLSLGEVAGCNPFAWSTKLQYQQNDVNIALAYNLHHNLRGQGLNDHIVMLAAGYNINPQAYIGAYYQTLQYDNPGRSNLKQNGFGLVGRVYFGPGRVELGWYHAGKGQGNQTPVFSGIYVGDGTQANLFVLGYRYALSKRVDLWSQVAQLRNGSNSAYDIGGARNAGSPGTLAHNPRAITVGIKYDF
ncbi:Outer membrane protein (porin) [Collimonas sp. OK607]|uniref:porin n=1 Tax=Collimonas sp. OK607 TaxID=1798194 RepID=UPI0008EA5B13|nr:porin [Collimonas sp. OK607]SFB16750.1 Outer membrane protein (porin) [Collimonas sp. OK607]